MKLFKNKVGRPSNEAIRKRRTAYVLIFIAVLSFLGVSYYYVSNMFNNSVGSKNKNATITGLKGDVASEIILTGDGKITPEDLNIMKRLVLGETINGKTKDTLTKLDSNGKTQKLIDVDGNGKLSLKDVEIASVFLKDGNMLYSDDVNIGDINKNGALDGNDLEIVKRYIAGEETLTEYQKDLADVNQDGKVTNADVDFLYKYAFTRNGYRLGDVNRDGVLNSADLQYIGDFSVNKIKLDTNQKELADINSDGKIDMEDRRTLEKIIRTRKTYNIGDINKDGNINSKDTEILEKYLNKKKKLVGVQYDLADVDRNGKIDKTDLTILQRVIQGYGDICNAYNSHGDGKITIEDFELIYNNIGTIIYDKGTGIYANMLADTLKYVRGVMSSSQGSLADMDGDKKITKYDANQVLNIINNKFFVSNSKVNGVSVSYDKTTQILTLNGTLSSNINLSKIIENKFVEGDKYVVTLTYVGGSLTKSGNSSFVTEVLKKDGKKTTTKRNVITQFPTSSNKTTTSSLVINNIEAKEGGQLYTWIYKNNNLIFNNYKIKVSIINKNLLTAVFEPDGSAGSRTINTCSTGYSTSCYVETPKIQVTDKLPEWEQLNDSDKSIDFSSKALINGNGVYYSDEQTLNKNLFIETKEKYDCDSCLSKSKYKEVSFHESFQQYVKMPPITGLYEKELIGWTTKAESLIPEYLPKDYMRITYKNTSNVLNLYPIIGKEKKATFNLYGLNSFDGKAVTTYTKTLSCMDFGSGCYIKLPEFNKSGYFNNFWSTLSDSTSQFSTTKAKNNAYFYKVNSLYWITKNITFYPNFNSYCYKDADTKPHCKYRNLSVQKSVTIGKTLFEFEKGIPDLSVSTYISSLKRIYDWVPFLFGEVKVFVMTPETYKKQSTAYGLTHVGNYAYNTIDLQYDNTKKAIDVNACIHELGHAWDMRYSFKTNSSLISNTKDFDDFYNSMYPKLYGNKKGLVASKLTKAEQENVLSKIETFAAMVSNYTLHVLGTDTNAKFYGFEGNGKMTSAELAKLKTLMEKYISTSNSWN